MTLCVPHEQALRRSYYEARVEDGTMPPVFHSEETMVPAFIHQQVKLGNMDRYVTINGNTAIDLGMVINSDTTEWEVAKLLGYEMDITKMGLRQQYLEVAIEYAIFDSWKDYENGRILFNPVRLVCYDNQFIDLTKCKAVNYVHNYSILLPDGICNTYTCPNVTMHRSDLTKQIDIYLDTTIDDSSIPLTTLYMTLHPPNQLNMMGELIQTSMEVIQPGRNSFTIKKQILLITCVDNA